MLVMSFRGRFKIIANFVKITKILLKTEPIMYFFVKLPGVDPFSNANKNKLESYVTKAKT
jgi:hypothetical protein